MYRYNILKFILYVRVYNMCVFMYMCACEQVYYIRTRGVSVHSFVCVRACACVLLCVASRVYYFHILFLLFLFLSISPPVQSNSPCPDTCDARAHAAPFSQCPFRNRYCRHTIFANTRVRSKSGARDIVHWSRSAPSST